METSEHPTVVCVDRGGLEHWTECSKCGVELFEDVRPTGVRFECGTCGAEWWEYEPIQRVERGQ